MQVHGHDIHNWAGEKVASWSYDHTNFANGGGMIRITRANGTFFHADSVDAGLALF